MGQWVRQGLYEVHFHLGGSLQARAYPTGKPTEGTKACQEMGMRFGAFASLWMGFGSLGPSPDSLMGGGVWIQPSPFFPNNC